MLVYLTILQLTESTSILEALSGSTKMGRKGMPVTCCSKLIWTDLSTVQYLAIDLRPASDIS